MKQKIIDYILVGLFLAWLIILAAFYIPTAVSKWSPGEVLKIETWTIKEERIELPYKFMPGKDEPVRLTATLPETDMSEKDICFWTKSENAEVYLNGKLIYRTAEDTKLGKAGAPQWNYVHLPNESRGGFIELQIESPYHKSFYLDEVIYGSREEIEDWIENEYAVGVIMDWMLFVAGISFMGTIIFRKTDRRYKIIQFLFGLTACLFAIWMTGTIKGPGIQIVHPYTATLLSLCAFFMIPVTLTSYVKIRAIKVPKLVVICDIFLLWFFFVNVGIFTLQIIGVRDLWQNVLIGNINLAISMFWALFVAMYYFKRNRERISALTVASGFLFLIAVFAKNYNNMAYPGLITRICIMMIIVFEFILLQRHITKNDEIQIATARQNQNLRLNFLTSQIRPHFILNTLGAIRSMIRIDSDKAYDLLYDFSQYIRNNLIEKDYTKPIPFLEEMDYINTYLRLERVRFGEKIQVKTDFEIVDFQVLPLTLQPFIENAVKHGLLVKKQGGTITIRSRKDKNIIIVEIEDDGVGFDTRDFWKGLEESQSFGMKSAIYRLKQELKGECLVISKTEPDDSGTLIHIELPVKRSRKHENNNC